MTTAMHDLLQFNLIKEWKSMYVQSVVLSYDLFSLLIRQMGYLSERVRKTDRCLAD